MGQAKPILFGHGKHMETHVFTTCSWPVREGQVLKHILSPGLPTSPLARFMHQLAPEVGSCTASAEASAEIPLFVAEPPLEQDGCGCETVLPHGKNHLVEGSCGKIIFSVIPSWPLFTQSGAEPLLFANNGVCVKMISMANLSVCCFDNNI